jgi:hypothetical protein
MPTYEFSAFVTSTADTEQEARTKAEELTHATSRSPEGVRVSLNDGSAAIVDDDTPGNIAIDEIADGRDYSDIVISNQTAQEAAIAELLALAEERGVSEDELDEHVHDVASREGSNVNNEGVPGQIAYLVTELGAAETRRILEQEVG